MILFSILLATFINGLVALVGAVSILFKQQKLAQTLILFVAFSAGALLGGAFFHLLPEALTGMATNKVFILTLIGFSAFFIMERYLHWHHCHENKCDVHPVSYLLLYGDAIHNFIDGLVIAASFMADIRFGIITTILIIVHELPQELGNFGVLVHSGMKVKKALLYNFIAQLTAVLGGLVGYFIGEKFAITAYTLPIAAGGFIYIAASDLIPELHKDENLVRSTISFMVFLLGLSFVLSMKLLLGE